VSKTSSAGRTGTGRALRWFLVVPAAVAGWLLALLVGLLLHGLADRLCPAQMMVSGGCIAPWHAPVVEAIVCVCAGLAAVLVILLPVLVAPGRRPVVAWVAFVGGMVFALYGLMQTAAWLAFACAAASGTATLAVVIRKERRRSAGIGDATRA
jgi:hypothetical protein